MGRTGQVQKWQPALVAREGNLASSARETWAFYRLRPEYTASKTAHELDAFIQDAADRVADLGGFRLWLRATTIPFPCDDYHDRLRDPLGSRVVGDEPGAITRDEIIAGAAYFPVDAVIDVVDGVVTRRLESRWPVAVVGVRLAERPLEQCDMRRVLNDEPAPASRQLVEEVRAAYRDVSLAVARVGWEASPLDNDSFGWLYDASIALGHPVEPQQPGDPSPLEGALVRAVQDNDGTTVPVRVDRDGDVTMRYSRIMRLRTWHERDTNALPAWIEWALSQPYRVDVAALFDVQKTAESVESIRKAVHHNAAIVKHLEKFGRPIGDKLRHATQRGPELLEAVEAGDAAEGCQIAGQVVFAVSGDTVREAVDNGKAFKAAAARGRGDSDDRGPGLVLDAPPAQYPEWRKFVPLEGWALRGHPQRQSTKMFASGLPQASRRAGDSTGAPFGAIADSTDFYLFDWFGGVRRNKAGLWGPIGDQGSGKSSILAYAAWWTALVECAPVTVLDPSNRISEQLRVPELWPKVRTVQLDVEGAPGTLASHFIIPDPRRGVYATDGEWDAAMEAAATERIEFAIDAAKAALPVPSMAGDPDVMECLRTAITSVGGEFGVQPGHIIDAIAAESSVGARLAKQIRAYSMLSGGKLLWADRRAGVEYASGGNDLVTIMSVAGVKSPRNPDPTTWDTAEARSVMLLSGAAQLASAHIWRDRSAKMMLIDEATNLLAGGNAFQGLMQRGALDSRKVTCSFGVAMHLADSMSSVGAHASSMFGAGMLMRTEVENARAALPMLRLQAGQGWEDLAPRLSNGEMVVSGWDDRPVFTRVDQAWLPDEFRRQLSTSTVAEVNPLRTLFGAQS